MEKEILEVLKLIQEGQEKIVKRLDNLEEGQKTIENKLDGVVEQTPDLTEFRTETKKVLKQYKEILIN